MTSKEPLLGSAYLQAPPTPPSIQSVDINTCLNLATFKYIMRQYRALDDSIIVRINRNAALFRQQQQDSDSTSTSEQLKQAECTKIWTEMLANWQGRERLIHYCVKAVDTRLDAKRKELEGSEGVDKTSKVKDELFLEEVTRNQLHNELSIESIVRHRSLQAFRSTAQCRFFEPPKALMLPLEIQSEGRNAKDSQ